MCVPAVHRNPRSTGRREMCASTEGVAIKRRHELGPTWTARRDTARGATGRRSALLDASAPARKRLSRFVRAHQEGWRHVHGSRLNSPYPLHHDRAYNVAPLLFRQLASGCSSGPSSLVLQNRVWYTHLCAVCYSATSRPPSIVMLSRQVADKLSLCSFYAIFPRKPAIMTAYGQRDRKNLPMPYERNASSGNPRNHTSLCPL